MTNDDSECYLRLIGLEKLFNKVKHAMSCDGIDPVPLNKWMIMSDMSFLIAQIYKHAVVLLSINIGQQKTFFPLRSEPSYKNQMMCLSHVNENY